VEFNTHTYKNTGDWLSPTIIGKMGIEFLTIEYRIPHNGQEAKEGRSEIGPAVLSRKHDPE
jgi:hypothetical protein